MHLARVCTAQKISGTVSALQGGRSKSLNVGSVGNLWLFKAVFSFRNSQKSHGTKSGEYGGWFNISIDFLTKNSRTATASRAGAL
jgi:hypothetical protein